MNLKTNDKYQLKRFFDHLSQISEALNDIVFKNEIEHVLEFYTEKGFDNFEKSLGRNLTLIYRFRNLIAHNATFPQYIIKYYAEDIEKITLRVIRKLIDECHQNKATIEDGILKCVVTYDTFN